MTKPLMNVPRVVDLMDEATIYDRQAFTDICTTVRGKHFIYGPESCLIGHIRASLLVLPFEAYSLIISLTLDGNSYSTSRIVQRYFQRPLVQGIVSALASMDALPQ
jgi:hypothetical protein